MSNTAGYGGTPTGSIQFVVNGSNYGSPVTLSGSTAQLSDTFSAAGTYSVTAIFSPSSGNLVTSTGTLSGGQTVNSTNVTSQTSYTLTGTTYNPGTGNFYQNITITNTGATAILGPIVIDLTNLTAGVTLVSASGSYQGNPYLTASTTALGGASATIQLVFHKPSLGVIDSFTPIVYSGLL